MNVKECFEKRMLRKIAPDREKAKSSLSISGNKLLRAKDLFNGGFGEEAFVSAYTSMFHAARALLYDEGVQEKGHYAVYVFLKEKFVGRIQDYLIESFKNYQIERHNVLYGFEKNLGDGEVQSSIEDAGEFLNKVKEVLGYGKI